MDTLDDPERCVVVHGLPTDLSAGTLKDKLNIHFQSWRKSSGGDVRKVELTDDGQTAYVWFEARETAQNVLQKEQLFEITVKGEKREVPLNVEARRAGDIKQDQTENADEDVAKKSTGPDDSADKKPTETSEETSAEGEATEGPGSERTDSLDDFVVLEREGMEYFDNTQTESQSLEDGATVGSPEKYLPSETERKLLLQDVQRELGFEKPSIVPSVNLYEGNSSVKSKTGPEGEKPLNNAGMTGSYISRRIVHTQEEALLKVHRNVMTPPDGATTEEEESATGPDEREDDDTQEASSIKPEEIINTGSDGKDCTIVVKGVKETTDADTLRDFFESKRISDGAEVTSLDRKDGVVTVTFNDAEAVNAVLKNRPLHLEGAELAVSVPTDTGSDGKDCTIVVKGVKETTDADTLRDFFESKRISDGAEVTSLDRKDGVVTVTFTDAAAVSAVLKNRPLHLEGSELAASVPAAERPREPAPIDQRRVFLTGLPQDTDAEIVALYMEARGRSEVHSVEFGLEPGTVLVTFEDAMQDMETVIRKCQGKPLHGATLSAVPVFMTDWIVVTNLPEQATTHKDTVALYFESKKRSGGGDVADVKLLPEEKMAYIQFENYQSVSNVVKREHKLQQTPIEVRPFHPCLGMKTATVKPKPIKMPSPVVVQVDPTVMQYMTSDDDSILSVKSSLRCVSASLEWPHKDDRRLAALVPSFPDNEAARAIDEPDWSHEALETFNKILSSFSSESIQVPATVWDTVSARLAQICNRADPDKKVVMKVSSTDQAMTLTGPSVYVSQVVKAIRDSISKEEEEYAKAIAVVLGPPIEMKPLELQHLLETGYIEAVTKKHRVEADTVGRLVFKGVSTSIHAATVEVYEKLRKISTNQMPASAAEGFLRFVTRDPWKSYIKKCIKEQRIQAHWAVVEGGMLTVVAESEDEFLKAVDRFKSTVTETEMPVHGPALKILDSDKWTSFLSTIQDSFSGLLQIAVNSDNGGKLVLITGPSGNVNVAKEQIDQFLKNNTVLESFVEMPVGVVEFLKKMKKEVIGKLQGNLQNGEGYITATTDGEVSGFTVVGTQDGIQQTVKHLQQLQGSVTHQQLSIQNPGMKKYFSPGQPGEEKLKSIGDVFNCIIKTHQEKKPDDIHCEPLNHVLLPRSRKLVVFKDDLTKHHVDAVTNAANKNLKNGGGLAEAIIKAGGREIQDHCDRIMKEEPTGLMVGAVRVTGPGKLPCKSVIHAVGPNFHEIKDDKRSRDELFITVTNVLEMASRYGFRSVAIPAISSGIFGGPLDLCTKTVVRATGLYFKRNNESNVNEVHFVGIDMDIAQSFNKAMLETFDEYGGWNPDSDSRENSLEWVVLPPAGARGPPPCPPEYAEHLVTPDSYRMFTNQGLKITLARGSISDQQADVIVNTIGSDLNLRTGAVSKALLDVAGPKLQVECDKIKKDLGRLPSHGEVVQTSAGNLESKRVYHAVCSFWNPQDSAKSEDVLRKIVSACLKAADKGSMRTIAFPALGTGGLGYPKDVVARLMFEETLSHSGKNPAGDLEEVKFVIYDQPSFEAFLSELGKNTEIGAGAASSTEPTSSVTAPDTEEPVAVQMTSDGSFKTKVTMRDVVVEVEQGDITREKVDAIVNPTRGDMDLSLGKVSQVLKRTGGPVVQTECEKYDKSKLKKDGVGITAAGGLASRYILHLVAPGFETEKWKKAVMNCLAFAESHQLKSLAFPALGTGQMAKDPTESATMIIEAIAEFAQKKNPKHLKHVRIVIFEAGMMKPFHDKLGKCLKTSSSLSLKNFVSGVKKLVKKIRPEPAKPPPLTPQKPVVQLDIYAGSKEDVESAANKINETANRESKTHYVTDKLIARLTDEDVATVQQKALERDVYMEICNGGKKIRLQGLAEDILVLQSEIHQILARVMNEGKQREHAQLIAAVIKWVYVENGTEVEFDRLTNLKIENALNEGRTRVKVDVDDVGECIAHLPQNILVTVQGGHRYKLKRKAAGEPEFPSTWTAVKSDFDMVSVDANSPEYDGIVSAFRKSAGGNSIEIQSVRRVQSRLCYTQYMTTKKEKETSGRISNKNLERRLYHGTSAETCDKIARHGFNRSFCRTENLYGSGVYFASSAFYALQDSYSRPDDQGYKHVFVAKVLTGDYCKGAPNLVAFPSKTEDGSLLYDSVVDDEENPNIFVVFHDTVAYPEYLIKFKEKSDTPAEWTRMRYDTALAIEPVDRSTAEYQRVSRMFTDTTTDNRTIVKIERIQSRFLWTQYQQRRQVLSAIFPPGMQFERHLFHGVSGNMCEDISIQGFNSHNAGNYDPDYGLGVYFTVNSADSAGDRHAPTHSATGERYMYLARVLTGGFCQGAPGLAHPQPWDLPDGTGDDVYLSAVDNAENPKIFVIFDVVAEVQAYPEYLITFK
ncbi:protein mono-ADP-ribosyltransferase PARP14-like isoform X2 [Branchiostoma lanceolatum]|uniref:protein mono-ADP-ribosyltransferase PARP14-like isoform X2 n=1 Tax=Branchiostoma lanceolatum TaxID=7740 RepID=UPI0034544103